MICTFISLQIPNAMTIETSHNPSLLIKSASLLIFVGLITGFLIAAAMTKQIHADGAMMLAAHLNALLGGFWLLGVGWTLPWCAQSPKQRLIMSWLLIISNYGNWLITLIKSFLKVHGVELTTLLPEELECSVVLLRIWRQRTDAE